MRLAKTLIVDRKRDVDFMWIGDGEDLPKMREMAAEMGIADRLHFVGHQEDVKPLLASSDIFALTSSEIRSPSSAWRPARSQRRRSSSGRRRASRP